MGKIPWHGNPLQYFCLGNPMDRGTWQDTVHRTVKSQTRPTRLSTQRPMSRRFNKFWYALTFIYCATINMNEVDLFVSSCKSYKIVFIEKISKNIYILLVYKRNPNQKNYYRICMCTFRENCPGRNTSNRWQWLLLLMVYDTGLVIKSDFNLISNVFLFMRGMHSNVN